MHNFFNFYWISFNPFRWVVEQTKSFSIFSLSSFLILFSFIFSPFVSLNLSSFFPPFSLTFSLSPCLLADPWFLSSLFVSLSLSVLYFFHVLFVTIYSFSLWKQHTQIIYNKPYFTTGNKDSGMESIHAVGVVKLCHVIAVFLHLMKKAFEVWRTL